MRKLLVILISFATLPAMAQLGGESTYAFLNLTNSARVASLGGKQVSLNDDDLNLAFHNPSLLSQNTSNHFVLNYVNYFAGVAYGYASYSQSVKQNNLAVGIHYIDYGSFLETDATGIIYGSFYASDYAVNLIWSRDLDSTFRVGVNLKPIYSKYERYSSYGFATDIGITYHNDDALFSAGLVIKNLGMQLKSYTANTREPLPFEIQLGVTQKLRYAPFRFSFALQHLQKFDYTYTIEEDEDDFSSFGQSADEKSKVGEFADKALRHVIVGVEFMPLKSFHLRFGYNYQRRQEMLIDTKVGMVGFSWGFGLKISKFHLSYGRATYHLAGASNHFSISTNLSQFYRSNEYKSIRTL